MKLSNLEITSTLRVTQPGSGSESAQTTDIRFAIDTGCVVAAEFYDLLLYELMNGLVSGESGVVTTGIKAIYYDETNAVLAQSTVGKLDKVVTESGTEVIAITTATKTDSTVEKFITKVDIMYIANDADTEDAKLIFTSPMPQKTTFAEATGIGVGKGVALAASGGDSLLTNTFNIFWK